MQGLCCSLKTYTAVRSVYDITRTKQYVLRSRMQRLLVRRGENTGDIELLSFNVGIGGSRTGVPDTLRPQRRIQDRRSRHAPSPKADPGPAYQARSVPKTRIQDRRTRHAPSPSESFPVPSSYYFDYITRIDTTVGINVQCIQYVFYASLSLRKYKVYVTGHQNNSQPQPSPARRDRAPGSEINWIF